MAKPLSSLLKGVEVIDASGGTDIAVTGVVSDSREVAAGSLFVAIAGLTTDSHDFIPSVIQNGAICVVGDRDAGSLQLPASVTYIQVANSRQVLGQLCANWWDSPSSKLHVIGITGTDGKTTSSHMLYSILKSAGHSVGMISTLGATINNVNIDTGLHVTSPDAPVVQRLLAQMVKEDVEYAIVEVTSHALVQERFSGTHFEVAALTNITHEHLDYHKTFEEYRKAKQKLFLMAHHAILNKDDDSFELFSNSLPQTTTQVNYSTSGGATYTALNIQESKSLQYTLIDSEGEHDIQIPILGSFNISNSLVAISVARHYNVPWQAITKALEAFELPDGRMEFVENNRDLRIVIDFAHTPNALEKLLTTLRKRLSSGQKLIVVFGCASERDREKRPLMGHIAAEFADLVVLTAEDPRRESIENINSEIMKGMKSGSSKVKTIDERGEAIYEAINNLSSKGDIIAICGKGHEKSLSYGTTEYDWSDKRAVELSLEGKIFHIAR